MKIVCDLPATPSRDQTEHSQQRQCQTGRLGNDTQIQRTTSTQFAGVFGQRQVIFQRLDSFDPRWKDIAQVDQRPSTLVQRIGLTNLERRGVRVGADVEERACASVSDLCYLDTTGRRLLEFVETNRSMYQRMERSPGELFVVKRPEGSIPLRNDNLADPSSRKPFSFWPLLRSRYQFSKTFL